MSSASASTEMPALKGISLEVLRVIFWVVIAMSGTPRRAAVATLFDVQSVTKLRATLSLSKIVNASWMILNVLDAMLQ